MSKIYGCEGDIDSMYENIHKRSVELLLELGVFQRGAFTIAFCQELDKHGVLRLMLFNDYIKEKDRYEVCHRLCDTYINVDWLWDCVVVCDYGRSGFMYYDMNVKMCSKGLLHDTTILDYEIIPFYNYEEFYSFMRR